MAIAAAAAKRDRSKASMIAIPRFITMKRLLRVHAGGRRRRAHSMWLHYVRRRVVTMGHRAMK